MTCGIYGVDWITLNNSRVPHNPCYFCHSCFKSYNYKDGVKIGSFQAFPYPCDNDLLKNEIVNTSNVESEKYCLSNLDDN